MSKNLTVLFFIFGLLSLTSALRINQVQHEDIFSDAINWVGGIFGGGGDEGNQENAGEAKAETEAAVKGEVSGKGEAGTDAEASGKASGTADVKVNGDVVAETSENAK